MLSDDGTAYELVGARSTPVVVLVHGLGLTRRIWDSYVPVLVAEFQVLTYDLCGHGESVLPVRQPSLQVLSEQLRMLLDELLIERVAIVGFSLGGMINRRFAMDYPERTSMLVILNSPHERSPEAQRLVAERATDTGTNAMSVTIDATLERWFTLGFRQSHPEMVAVVRDEVLANDTDNYTHHRQVLANGVTELILPTPPITTPSLVITCEHDSGSTPAMSYAIASEISGARVIIVPGLQHMGLVEAPELFCTPIVTFLNEINNCSGMKRDRIWQN